jgi:uncharacterized membrane protein
MKKVAEPVTGWVIGLPRSTSDGAGMGHCGFVHGWKRENKLSHSK